MFRLAATGYFEYRYNMREASGERMFDRLLAAFVSHRR